MDGFDLPLEHKNIISENIEKHLENRSVLNLNTLLILCGIDEKIFTEIFDNEARKEVNLRLARNNVNMKLHCLDYYFNDDNVNSKKELMKLATLDDEFERISNQWTVKEVVDDYIVEKPDYTDDIYGENKRK